jgi:DNA-binding XRE family transcriptional regulator
VPLATQADRGGTPEVPGRGDDEDPPPGLAAGISNALAERPAIRPRQNQPTVPAGTPAPGQTEARAIRLGLQYSGLGCDLGLRGPAIGGSETGAAEAYDAAKLDLDLGRAVRELRGWSQAQLAHAAEMTQSAVARFEAGGTVPTLPVLERLARALDVELSVRFTRRPRLRELTTVCSIQLTLPAHPHLVVRRRQ